MQETEKHGVFVKSFDAQIHHLRQREYTTGPAGTGTGPGTDAEDHPTIASATASATRMPSMAADMMPPA
jgi:hypothetical protein